MESDPDRPWRLGHWLTCRALKILSQPFREPGLRERCDLPGRFLATQRSFPVERSEESSEEEQPSYFDLVKRFTTKKVLPVVRDLAVQSHALPSDIASALIMFMFLHTGHEHSGGPLHHRLPALQKESLCAGRPFECALSTLSLVHSREAESLSASIPAPGEHLNLLSFRRSVAQLDSEPGQGDFEHEGPRGWKT